MTYPQRLVAALVFALPTVASGAEVRGVIAEIDLTRKQLVIDARGLGIRGTVMVFMLPDNVPVTHGQNAGKLADLGPGKRVRITYDVRDNKLVVTGIHSIDLGGIIQGVQQVIPALTGQGQGGAAPAPNPPAVAPPMNDAPPPPGAAPAPGQVAPAQLPTTGLRGALRRIAPTEREIIVAAQGPAGEQYAVFAVPDTARILRDGQPIAFEALRPEEPAVVRGEKRNGKLTAVTVQVGQVAPEAAAPAGNTLPMPAPVAGQPMPAPQQPAAESRIGTVRRVLQIADGILEQIEKQREGK